MVEMKNCPSCGGTLDDDGRCKFCGSKVYDLTDINIDVNSRDRIKLRLKMGNKSVIFDCYPANITWEQRYEPYLAARDVNGKLLPLRGETRHTFTLELMTI